MSETLIELSNALAQIAERAATHLVAVHSGSRGSSSGIIWRSGVIVTADHALQHDDEVRVTLPDQREFSATLAGRDPATDIAILRCAEGVPAQAPFADASAFRPGHLTLVVGRTRVSGPVAALATVSLAVAERKQWGGAVLAPYLRLDLNLPPTAVGGAVLDVHGALVGMATPRFARFGAIAIPAATVDRIAEVLLTRGRIPRGYLGIGMQPIRIPSDLLSGGARRGKTATIVLDVAPSGPAHNAGILVGDLILSLGGKEILHPGDVHAQLGPESVGKTLPLSLARAGKVQDLQIAVAERPIGDN